MQNRGSKRSRERERGAVQIKTVLALAVLAAAIFLAVKLAPVYVEQRQVTHDVEELARIAAVRAYNSDKINKEIETIRGKYNLKEGSISLVAREQSTVQIAISYNVPVDLLVTTYNWEYRYTAHGKEF